MSYTTSGGRKSNLASKKYLVPAMSTGVLLLVLALIATLSPRLGSTISSSISTHLPAASGPFDTTAPHRVSIVAAATTANGNDDDAYDELSSDDEQPTSIIADGRIVGHSRPNAVQRITRRTANTVKAILKATLISFPKKVLGIFWKIFPFLPRLQGESRDDANGSDAEPSQSEKTSVISPVADSRKAAKTDEAHKKEVASSTSTKVENAVLSAPPKKQTDPSKINDHNPCDINLLGLKEDQLKRINDVVNHPVLKSKQIQTKAKSTQFDITQHLAYRYMRAVDWVPQYNGRDFHDAIADTVQWRDEFGIASIDKEELRHYVSRGVAYTGGLDKHGRAIIYMKVGRNDKTEKNYDIYKRLLMYTVERADRLSETHGSGEFVALIDLKDFAWSKVPPTSVMKECLGLLKKHYPYRIGAIIIVNAGLAFNILWKLFQPLMPRKALAKTFVLTKGEMAKKLDETIGMYFLEEAYGGLVKEDHSDVDKYFEQGYWHGKKVSWSINVPVSVT